MNRPIRKTPSQHGVAAQIASQIARGCFLSIVFVSAIRVTSISDVIKNGGDPCEELPTLTLATALGAGALSAGAAVRKFDVN